MAKVLFAQEIFFPFQSIAKLSAFLKQSGHDVDLVIGDAEEIISHINKTKPNLIAFSVLTPYRNHMLASAKAIKKAGITIPIIAGGYDITFLPQILEHSGLDLICRGEGETPLTELCDRIDNNGDFSTIPNLWVKKNGRVYKNHMRTWSMNMDELPFDDRDIYLNYDPYFKMIPFTQVLVGRGCPYPCSYCFNDGYRKIYASEGSRGYCKLRSVENLLTELLILQNRYNAKYFFFNDSTLGYNKKWLLEFLKQYREKIKIPFSINVVITEIDEEVGKALAVNDHCELVRFGLETGNEEFRKKVLNKNISNKQYCNGVEILSRYGIRYSMAMMLGLPGETLALSWDTIEMANRISGKKSVHAVNIFKPFPGLDITEYGIKIGQYRREDVSATNLPENISKGAEAERDGDKGDLKDLALGTRDLCFYENYRIDETGKIILRLSRFSHLAIRFPSLRPLIKKLIKLPDNFFYRLIWTLTEGMLNIRAHANVPLSFFVKFFLFHRSKRIR